MTYPLANGLNDCGLLHMGLIEPEFLTCEFCDQDDFINEEELVEHQEEFHYQEICEHPASDQREIDGELECQLCEFRHGGPDGDGPDD